MTPLPAPVRHALRRARDLVDAVSFDDQGVMVGQVRMGGNGGLLGNDTIAIAEELRRLLDAIPVQAPSPSATPVPGSATGRGTPVPTEPYHAGTAAPAPDTAAPGSGREVGLGRSEGEGVLAVEAGGCAPPILIADDQSARTLAERARVAAPADGQ